MDIRELYDNTRVGTFVTALSILGDRQLARDAAVEAYKRAEKLAYKFDENMSSEYWITDMVKNICTNGLRKGEISQKASTKLQDNVTLITKYALFESKQDRGVIVAVKLGTKLTMNEVANILWYRKFSLKGEYTRCLKEAGERADVSNVKETEDVIRQDFEKITPDYYDFIENDEYETPFKDVSEAYENVKEKNNKKLWIAIIAIALILATLAAYLTVYFIKKKKSELKQEEIFGIKEPLMGASEAMTEADGKLYFENRSDGATLYCYDIKTGKSEKISDAKPKDFMKSGDRIYFRNSKTGHLSYIDAKTGKVTESAVLGALPAVYGDKIAYSNRSGVALCDANLSKESEKVIFETERYIERIAAVGKELYISTGASKGIIRLTEMENGEFSEDYTLDSIEFFDIKVTNGLIIFEDGLGNIVLINVSNPKANTKTTLENVLYSAAFCVSDGNIYYNGKDGIYVVSIDDALSEKKGTLAVDLKERKHTVSDLYVSGENIYCYFSNGEKDEPYNELRLYREGDSVSGGKLIYKVGK